MMSLVGLILEIRQMHKFEQSLMFLWFAVGSGRGRVPSGRGGYRSDSFRARSNYGGGRGFGRNEYGNRGEFSGRGRARGGDGYRQGGGRGGARQTGPTHDADTS